MSDLRIVVPTLDEAETLPGLLADLAAQRGVDFEVVIADGGSRDATVAIARADGRRCIECAPGRGHQMNQGALDFTGRWLLFLHADTRLVSIDQLADAVAALAGAPETTAGHFALSFALDGVPARGLLYRYMAAKTRTNRRHTINGDQGCLIRRGFFMALGGYDTQLSFLEDQRLAGRIHDAGHWQLLPHAVITSARRFEREGRLRRYALMGLIMAMYVGELETFFTTADTIYAPQSTTGRLQLAPYFKHALAVIEAAGPARGACALWHIAGVVHGEAWQLRLAFVVALGRGADAEGPAKLARGARSLSSSALAQPVHVTAHVVLFFALAVAVFGPLACLRLFSGGRVRRP
ncbi:TIGR04283 family arsenosugar biosynthesis glycosyltransferase [Salinisphaera japonica]|uniref:Glycosyl transferase family 2 n=1 Tax=Salinisphaera japonica YTM-1 TaxID=1209778 RepID=A0A423Q096_9GAMM|nr:TIGR04283 family arsenosugar biosynthesis glycosyltransferase [Salinisphaera japonica]ROO31420.1 glycosyl transferase family 2 [Salinisphaera japonica YTM-1]